MVGATRPGRVLLIFAVVAACHVAIGGAIWYASLPVPVSCELNEEIVTELPMQSFSESAEDVVPDPQASRMTCPLSRTEPPGPPVKG